MKAVQDCADETMEHMKRSVRDVSRYKRKQSVNRCFMSFLRSAFYPCVTLTLEHFYYSTNHRAIQKLQYQKVPLHFTASEVFMIISFWFSSVSSSHLFDKG